MMGDDKVKKETGTLMHYAQARNGYNPDVFRQYGEAPPRFGRIVYPGDIQYRYVSENVETHISGRFGQMRYLGDALGANIVSLTGAFKTASSVVAEDFENVGSLYFEHGFIDAGGLVVEDDEADLGGRSNANLSEIARVMIDNDRFTLEIGAHADGSGNGAVYADDHEKYPGMLKNEALALERLGVAENMLIKAFEAEILKDYGYGEGKPVPDDVSSLAKHEAQELYTVRRQVMLDMCTKNVRCVFGSLV